MDYNALSLKKFINERLGNTRAVLFEPMVDRLVVLYCEFNHARKWLDTNDWNRGSKEYKDMVSLVNSMMPNINRLEEKIGLFDEKRAELGDNDLVNSLRSGAL